MDYPPVLDACCGGRMFWFDKDDDRALFIDKRTVAAEKLTNGQTFEVKPDVVMDFRAMSFPDATFSLVVFDPPHLVRNGQTSYMAKKYGSLGRATWKDDLRQGFAECFRVLKGSGVLVFKWNETDIHLADILALTPHKPLFGHRSGRQQKTHWVAFIKP